jgi:3-oxoadipate enol-lactonase
VTSVNTGWLTVDVEGDGPAILFVHGLGGSSNTFQPLIGALAGYRCIRPDLPGSARSRRPHGKLTVPIMAKAVTDAARAVGASSMHLVGHSLGTHLCQHISAQMPEAILSMTLFGPIYEPGDASRARLRERAQLARAEGMNGIADAMIHAAISADTRASNPLAAAFVRESHMRQDAEGFAQSCEALADTKAADAGLIKCPVLLVTGEEDGVAPPSAAHALAEKISGAKTKILERCGHWTPIEQPDQCARLLADFLRDIRR